MDSSQVVLSVLAGGRPTELCSNSDRGRDLDIETRWRFIFLFRDLIAFYFSVKDLIAFYLCIYRPDCLFVYLGLFVQIVDLLSISQPIQPNKQRMNSAWVNTYKIPKM
jgi:hypothetical protein